VNDRPSADPANRIHRRKLRRLVPDVAERDVYFCVDRHVRSSSEALREAGPPDRRLHKQSFTLLTESQPARKSVSILSGRRPRARTLPW
jgi:ferredoxin-NADP reductase